MKCCRCGVERVLLLELVIGEKICARCWEKGIKEANDKAKKMYEQLNAMREEKANKNKKGRK